MYDDLLSKMRSPNAEVVGKASADFAQQLWNGKVSDTLLTSVLKDSNDVVRSEVAWAIADAHRPLAGIKWLITDGLIDGAEGVRFWATRYLIEAGIDVAASCKERLVKMQEDVSERVRDNVRILLSRLKDQEGQV